jgi:threonine/homoserine/homoserine lactone efflux protein
MGNAIADILPAAIGVAISPIPIIAVILMLFSAKARSNGPAFMLGWMLGLTIVAIIVLLVADPTQDAAGDDSSTLASIITLVLGLLLLLLAVRQWQGRPKPGEEVELPKWMQAIDAFTPGKALGMGMLLSGLNPKNLIFDVAAAVAIAQANLSFGGTAILLAIFVLLGSVSIAGPVIYYLVGGESAQKTLDGWKVWLSANNAAVMAVLLLVLGVKFFAQGLGGLID